MSTRRCPHCGERLGAQARFCKTCGAQVEPQWDDLGFDPNQNRRPEQPEVDRRENRQMDWTETGYYGNGPAEPPKGSGKKWIPIAAAVCVLIAVIGVSVFSILHVGKSNEISIERVQNSDGTWLEYAYNANGNLETETKYSADGEKDFWTEYEYDDNGNRTKETHYDKNGEVGWIYIYEYDAAGNQLKQERTDKNGTPEWRIETEYDGDKKTKATEYNAKNEKINYHLYDYEGKNLVKDTIYNTDNSIKEYTTITYNQNNQKTAETKYNGANVKISHVETSYNDDGTVAKETVTNEDGKTTVKEHEYEDDTDPAGEEKLSGSAEEPESESDYEQESDSAEVLQMLTEGDWWDCHPGTAEAYYRFQSDGTVQYANRKIDPSAEYQTIGSYEVHGDELTICIDAAGDYDEQIHELKYVQLTEDHSDWDYWDETAADWIDLGYTGGVFYQYNDTYTDGIKDARYVMCLVSSDLESLFEENIEESGEKSEETPTEEASDPAPEWLTSQYWWNRIQDINAFRFEEDGTWYSVECTYSGSADDLEIPLEVLGEKSEFGWEGTYTLDGDILTLNARSINDSSESFTWTFHVVTCPDGYDLLTTEDARFEWEYHDYPIQFAEKNNYTGPFFYEIDYVDSHEGSDNANWLMPYEDLVEQIGSSNEDDQADDQADDESDDEANADQYPIPERTLYYDADNPMTGDDVKYVQAALTEMAYTGITLNGTYDSATEDAVIRFQENHNLVVDGRAGPQTIGELTESLDAWRQTH